MTSHDLFQRAAALVTGAACCLAMLPASLTAAAAYTVSSVMTGGQESSNVGRNDHFLSNWSAPVTSYLVETAQGYSRVEYVSGTGVLVEDMTADGTVTGSRVLPMALPIWGGFFAGEDAYYLVFGQDDPDEIAGQEVLRIVKYGKDWTQRGTVGLSDLNTAKIFDSGTLRMTENDGVLYLHTSRTMFKINDYNHQANMTLAIRESDLTPVDLQTKVVSGYGYVSHSFDQFVCAEEDVLYRVDQGDFYPRAVVLQKNALDADGKLAPAMALNIIEVGGSYADNANFTGIHLGGMALSEANVLTVGTSIDQSHFPAGVKNLKQDESGGQYNVFLNIADKSLGGSRTVWITSYGSNDAIEVGTPQLVKCRDDRFLILWEESRGSGRVTRTLAVDGSGNIVSEVRDDLTRLSDCAPIYTQAGKVVWYVTMGTAPTVYTLTPDLGLPEADTDATCTVRFVDAVTGEPVKGAQIRVDHVDDVNADAELTAEDGTVTLQFKAYSTRDDADGTVEVIGVPEGYRAFGYGTQQFDETTGEIVIRLVPLPDIDPDVRRGDADQSGEVDAADASTVLVYSTRRAVDDTATLIEDAALEEKAHSSADVNYDGEINAVDASIILVYCTELGVGHAADWDALCQ